MPTFSESSKAKLATCDYRLQLVFKEVIKLHDCTILCGVRGEAEQNEAYRKGWSTKKFPGSNHNKSPSRAVDAAPWYPEKPHINWDTDVALLTAYEGRDKNELRKVLENIKRWQTFVGLVLGTAYGLGIKLRNGGDWDKDFRYNDHRLIDLPHFEIIGD